MTEEERLFWESQEKKGNVISGEAFTIDPEEKESILQLLEKRLDSIKNIPSSVSDFFTGDNNPVEFPDVREITQIADMGFLESLIPNTKLMLSRDDLSKAEIIRDTFEKDERFGGVFQDKFNNPLIVWNEQPYYINKPGFSSQDIGTVLGEIVKFMPATKFVGGAKTILSTVARAFPSYSATELGSKAIEAQLAPETARKKEQGLGEVLGDAATMGAFGTAVDVAVPPVMRGVGKITKNIGERIAPIFPRYEAGVKNVLDQTVPPVQSSKYPLTQGQRTSPLPDTSKGQLSTLQTKALEEEDMIRRAASTNEEANILMKGFDENQLNQIRQDADSLTQELGSGQNFENTLDVPTAVGEEIKKATQSSAEGIKEASSARYKSVREAKSSPIVTREGVKTIAEDVLNIARSEIDATRQLKTMPILADEMKFLQRLIKITSNPRFKGQSFKQLFAYQKTLNRAVSSSVDANEQRILGIMKRTLDDYVFNGIEKGFITGDQAVLDALKEATGLYKQYMGLTGKGKGANAAQNAANKILQKITNPDYDVKEVVNALFGHAKFAPKNGVTLVIKRLKENLPPEQSSQIIGLIKDGVLSKAFSGSGKSGVTRTNIVNNFVDVFVKNKSMIDELFSADEIAKIKQFRDNVMPTLWAEIKLNPSGTSYVVSSALARAGLFLTAPKLALISRAVPMVESALKRGERLGAARDAIKQYVLRSNMPLFSGGIQSLLRPPASEAISDDPEVINFLRDIPSQTREKIMQTVN